MSSDLDALQGEWYLTSFELDGNAVSMTPFASPKVVIDGDRFLASGMGAPYAGKIVVDATKEPKSFDLVITAGHAAGTRNRGIYRLGNESWTLCLATQGDERPRSFDSKPNTGVALETFARTPAAESAGNVASMATRPSAEPAGESTALEGEWAMVAAVFNGKPMPDESVRWCRRTTRGDVTKVVAGPNVMLEARFTLDTAASPWSIDYVNLAGPVKGQSQLGIAELRGDSLQICMSPPGAPRPSEFASTAGDKRSYTTWRRLGSE